MVCTDCVQLTFWRFSLFVSIPISCCTQDALMQARSMNKSMRVWPFLPVYSAVLWQRSVMLFLFLKIPFALLSLLLLLHNNAACNPPCIREWNWAQQVLVYAKSMQQQQQQKEHQQQQQHSRLALGRILLQQPAQRTLRGGTKALVIWMLLCCYCYHWGSHGSGSS